MALTGTDTDAAAFAGRRAPGAYETAPDLTGLARVVAALPAARPA